MDMRRSPDESSAVATVTQLSTPGESTVIGGRSDSTDEWLWRFEQVYRDAGDSVDRVPWAGKGPDPMLISWLDREGRDRLRPGARVCVAGSGLGHDVAALNDRGYDAVGVDACASAIESARRLHPEHTGAFRQADLFGLPSNLTHRFDAVIEVCTIQSTPPEHRARIVEGMASLLKRHGLLISIFREHLQGPTHDLCAPVQPPFDLSGRALADLLGRAGMTQISEPCTTLDQHAVQRSRAVFGFADGSPR